MTTAYQVSTPSFTCLVVVDAGGRICDTAPLLRRRWLGQSWRVLQTQMRQAWGSDLRIDTLGSKDEGEATETMPTGIYDRAITRYSHQDFVLYLLREGPMYASDLIDRLRSRVPDRRACYALLRAMERDGRLTSTISQTGGQRYDDATMAQTPQGNVEGGKGIMVDEWRGAYKNGWPKELLVPESFEHPAKFSYDLIQRIYAHARAEGWLPPGSVVLDCFAGAGLGALEARRLGCAWHGVELEAHFHDIGAGCACTGITKADWVRFYGRWARMSHAQDRHWCPQCLNGAEKMQREADLFRTSASYIRDVGTKDNVATFATRHTNRPSGRIPTTRPHHYEGNLERWQRTQGHLPGFGPWAMCTRGDSRYLTTLLRPGNLSVASPPYAQSTTQPTALGDGKDTRATRKSADRNKGDYHYGTTPGNLSTLAVSSPPYTGSQQVDNRTTLPSALSSTWRKRFGAITDGHDPAQLANMSEGNPSIAVSSPPYANGCTHTGGADPQPQHVQGGEVRHVAYGETPGNLANCVVSSPPYADVPIADARHLHFDTQRRERCIAEKQANGVPIGYGSRPGQLGTEHGTTFWEAAALVVQGVFTLLQPGGHAIWVVKSYCREGAIVDFPGQWRALCERCGFITLHEHHALLVEEHGTQTDLFGADTVHKTEKKSFFRRLHERKRPDLAINHETVYCMVKPGADGPGAQCCVSSPPYVQGLGKEHTYADHTKREKDSHRRIRTEKGIADPYYGSTPGNLGNMSPGCVISSPPYADSWHRADSTAISEKRMRAAGYSEAYIAQGFRASKASGGNLNAKDYGQSAGQLGAMREGTVQAVISSPPYVDSVNSQQHGIDWTKAGPATGNRQRGAGTQHEATLRAQLQYGHTEGQLGAIREGSIPSIVVSSPLYAGTGEVLGTHNGIDWTKTTGTGQRLTPGTGMDPYGTTPGNLGNMPPGTRAPSAQTPVTHAEEPSPWP